MLAPNKAFSIHDNFSEVKGTLQEQIEAYLPQITQKCNDQMISLLNTITTPNANLTPSESQTIYTHLTQKSYQELFKKPPSIFTRAFNWYALGNWEEGKKLAIKIQAICLISFKDPINERLDLLLESLNAPLNIKKAAQDLKVFLSKPNDHLLSDTTLDLLKDENIFPEDLDFEKDKDLMDLQLCLKNELFSKIPNLSFDKGFTDACEKAVEVMQNLETQTSLTNLDQTLKTTNLEKYKDDLSKRFKENPFAFKSFLMHSVRSCNPSLTEAFATKLTSILIPSKDVSQDDDILHWADKPFNGHLGRAPYIILAKLLSCDPVKINAANEYILTLTSETKALDLSHFLKSFAYLGTHDDFSIAAYTTILYRCKDSLTPDAKKHILDNLLKLEGEEFSDKTPNLPMLTETENHILLINSSRYLKNKYLHEAGDPSLKFDNSKNGLEEKLLAKLNKIKETGLDEYNSIPYIAYSIIALLNLHEFGSLPIQKVAKDLLDDITDRYAHASCGLKSFFPFRRQGPKGRLTDLSYSYQLKSLYKWLSDSRTSWMSSNLERYKDDSRMLLPACLSYKLQDKTKARLTGKDQTPYLTQISHSKTAIGGSPEIYYGDFAKDKKYLLSAGGSYPKGIYQNQREIIVRPTTLLLDDDKTELKDVFYLGTEKALEDPHIDAADRNNTGVYQNFACGACPVHIPEGNAPIATLEESNWKLHKAMDGLLVAIYNTEELGIMVTFKDDQDPSGLLKSIHNQNPNPSTSFTFPDGKTLTYDTKATQTQWVMESETVNGEKRNFERDFSKWDTCTNTYVIA